MTFAINDKRPPTKSFQDLVVWQKAHKLVLEVYAATRLFPKEELYGLTSQIRRSVVSVPANIAEGFKKQSKPEKIRYLNIAQASLEETRYFLILAADLGYLNKEQMSSLAEEVSKMLDRYVCSIRENDHKNSVSRLLNSGF